MLTVFDAQHQEIQSYTPEWAAANTGISAADIRKIARDFHQAKSPILIPGWSGARYGNIQMLRRVQAMIQGLKGGFDVPGGWIFGGDYREQVRHMKRPPQGRCRPRPRG
ncbi:hypothetical protein [Acidithiobacillus sp.]